MKNPRAFLFALLVALIATFAQCRYVAQREQSLLYETAPLKTLVAVKDIRADVRIDETMVKQVDVPRRWQQPKALTSVDDIVNQITAVPIFKDEQILSTKLVTADEAGLAYYVPQGYRALSLAVDVYNAVGGHIKPGNQVDVLGTFDFGNGEKMDLRTVTLMQDVRVLAVVDDIGRPTTRDVVPNTPPEEGPTDKDKDKGPSETVSSRATVSIAVRPPDAQKLVMAQEMGKLTVTLRSLWEAEGPVPLDQATIATTLGIAQQVRFKSRPAYRVIEGGGN